MAGSRWPIARRKGIVTSRNTGLARKAGASIEAFTQSGTDKGNRTEPRGAEKSAPFFLFFFTGGTAAARGFFRPIKTKRISQTFFLFSFFYFFCLTDGRQR
jgi:hypothetical protein